MKTRKIVSVAAAIAAASVLAGCGGVVAPTVTVTESSTRAQSSAPAPDPTTDTPTPTPEPSTPDLSETAALYQAFSGELAGLMGTFSDQATAGLVDDAADTLEELGTKAQEGLDLPDTGIPGVDSEWDAAMKDYAAAARIGVPAIRNLNVAGMNKATSYIQKGTDHISAATAALQDYAG